VVSHPLDRFGLAKPPHGKINNSFGPLPMGWFDHTQWQKRFIFFLLSWGGRTTPIVAEPPSSFSFLFFFFFLSFF
jgi:hypothetical protein